MISQANGTIEELDKEWVELIKTAIHLKIPLEEIKKFLSDKKGCLKLIKN